MSSIKGRIDKLEYAIRGGDRCPTCGRSPGDPPKGLKVTIVKEGDPPPAGPDVCPDCGTTLRVHVQFDLGKLVSERDVLEETDGPGTEGFDQEI